jgi:chromosome segregation ATPase
MDRFPAWIAAATCIAAAMSLTATAQTARTGGNANAQLLQQMQQVAAERTTLQAENDKLKGELAEVKKERDALKAGQQIIVQRAQGAAAALAHSNTERAAGDQELTQLKAKMQELVGKFRETLQKFREVEADGSTAKQTLAKREQELAVCVDRNVALYNLDEEVLTRWEKEGVWSRIADKEPFTRIKRTQLENLIDGYRERASEQRISREHTSTPSGAGAQVSGTQASGPPASGAQASGAPASVATAAPSPPAQSDKPDAGH